MISEELSVMDKEVRFSPIDTEAAEFETSNFIAETRIEVNGGKVPVNAN